MRKNRRTNMKRIVAFRNFANALEKHYFHRLAAENVFMLSPSTLLATFDTNHKEKGYVNSRILVFCLSEAKI